MAETHPLETKAEELASRIHRFQEAMPDDHEKGVTNHRFSMACALLGGCAEIIQEMAGGIERIKKELKTHKDHSQLID